MISNRSGFGIGKIRKVTSTSGLRQLFVSMQPAEEGVQRFDDLGFLCAHTSCLLHDALGGTVFHTGLCQVSFGP